MPGSLFVTVRDKKRNIIVSITKRALSLSPNRYETVDGSDEDFQVKPKKNERVAAPAAKNIPTPLMEVSSERSPSGATVVEYTPSKISEVQNPGPTPKKRGRPKKNSDQ